MLSASRTNSDAPAPSDSSPGLVWPWLFVLLIAGVFLAACVLPAAKVTGGLLPGWACLTFGILYFPVWLANPLLFAGCACLATGRNAAAFLLGLAAVFPALFAWVGLAGLGEVTWGYYLWAGDVALLTTFAGVRSYLWGDRELPVATRRPPGPAEPSDAAPGAEGTAKAFSGPVVLAELYQQALAGAGIKSRVVGLELSASFGSALPNSVEVWVAQRDAGPAAVVLEAFGTGQ
jgi:hypothetical protein